jgi:hypothetical protein
MNGTLTVERKAQPDTTTHIGPVSLTPAIGGDYWAYRVLLSDHQAVVAFPKFSTIGIGFAVEEDWNTNLPYTIPADEIAQHILHNKGDDTISDESVVQAIRLIQEAIAEDVTGPETVTAEVTLTADRWRIERDGRFLGITSILGCEYLAVWPSEEGPQSTLHATRDEAVAAVVAGINR